MALTLFDKVRNSRVIRERGNSWALQHMDRNLRNVGPKLAVALPELKVIGGNIRIYTNGGLGS